MKKILVINPGSTSTKIAVYNDEKEILVNTIRHSMDELAKFPRIIDQFEFRKELVLKTLEENSIPFQFDAIVGRGGLLKPIPGGVYEVNDAMLNDIMHAMRTHACNLGCLLASELKYGQMKIKFQKLMVRDCLRMIILMRIKTS